MHDEDKSRLTKIFVMAVKIAIASSLSIYIAESLGLQFAASAGIIALLSVVTTKWGTVRISLLRILTFLLSVGFSWAFYQHLESEWIAYGLFILLLVGFSEYANVRSTISVNAVISTHFLSTHDFSLEFVLNEFMLVLIGTSVAILFDLIQNNTQTKKKIIANICYTEEHLQAILEELAGYLFKRPMKEDVWEDIIALEKKVEWFMDKAHEYQDNTFQSHPSYYIHYFEMRLMQCNILYSLHSELEKLRSIPQQAEIVAEFMVYMKEHIREMNDPKEQIGKLEELLEKMRGEELPKTMEEFESRAELYHILMDIEEFLMLKRRFVEEIDEKQKRIYWNAE